MNDEINWGDSNGSNETEEKQIDAELNSGLDSMFETPKDEKNDLNLSILVFGDAGSGKTHFSLTGNSPILAVDTEGPMETIANKIDTDVKIRNVQYYNDENEIDGTKSMEDLMKISQTLWKNSNAGKDLPGTVVIDSMSDVWYYARRYMKEMVYKEKGRDQVYQFDWSIANNKMKTFTKQLLNTNTDVVMTAQRDEEYDEEGNATGQFKPKGWKDLPYQVDVILHIKDAVDIDTETGKSQRKRVAEIQKCRHNDDLVDKRIKHPTIKKVKEAIKNGI